MKNQKSEVRSQEIEVRSEKLEVRRQKQRKRFSSSFQLLASSFLFLASAVHAQAPALTTVKDTVYKSDGSLASGTVVITWKPFVTAENKAVFGGTKTVPLNNGSLTVALAPNGGATPSGTSYNVKYYQSGAVFFEETWVVPASSPLGGPAAPTATNVGAPGSATYCYWISGLNAEGETLIGPAGCTTTGNATLDGSNYNQVSWSAVTGATAYRVYRTANTTAPAGTGNYLAGETSNLSLDDQTNTLQAATIPTINTTDPRTLSEVRVTAAPSPSVVLAASQVTGNAIVSNPSSTQSINAPPTAGVVPLQIKGHPQDGANLLEIFNSQNPPSLQSYFDLNGAFRTSQTPTFSTMTSGSILFAGSGGLLSQDNANLFWKDTTKQFIAGPRTGFNPAVSWLLEYPGSDPYGQSVITSLNNGDKTGPALLLFNQDNHPNTAGNDTSAGIWAITAGTHGTGTKGVLQGINIENYQLGNGNVTWQNGIDIYLQNAGSGTVNTMRGLWVKSFVNDGGGTVSNLFGLKIEDQTAGTNNWAIRTGLGKVEFGDDVIAGKNLYAKAISNVRYADQFAGADGGAKIAAACADLPSTGGTVDARGLEGSQAISAQFACDKPFTLITGHGTYTVASGVTSPAILCTKTCSIILQPSSRFKDASGNTRGNPGTILKAGAGYTGYLIGVKTTTDQFAAALSVIEGGTLDGNDRAAAAVFIQNTFGVAVRDTLITGAAVGVQLLMTNGLWVEGSKLEDIVFENNLKDVEVRNNGGTGSTGHAKWTNLRSFLVQPNAKMFDFVGQSGIAYSPYASILSNFTVWVAATATNSRGVDLSDANSGTGSDAPWMQVFFESDAASFTGWNIPAGKVRPPIISTGIAGSGSLFSSDTNDGVTLPSYAKTHRLVGQGTEYLDINPGTAATGRVRVTAGPTAGTWLNLRATGAGGFAILGNTAQEDVFRAGGVTSGVNGLEAFGAIATASPSLGVFGNDTNINLTLKAKGTGAVKTADAFVSPLTPVTFSATPAFDASLGNSFKMTLTANVTSSTIANVQTGQFITLLLCQDGTGNRAMTWPSNLKLSGGSFTLTTTAAKCDSLTAVYDGSNWYETARATNL